MFSLIVAVDKNGVIGLDATIPWRLREDMRSFKAYTTGKVVLMGHKTAVSIGQTLPKRTNLVMSRDHSPPFPGQLQLSSVGEAILYDDLHCDDQELVVCGGGQIYRAMMPYVKKAVVTHVNTEIRGGGPVGFEGLITFPGQDLFAMITGVGWVRTSITQHPRDEHNVFDFNICTYVRDQPSNGHID
jgi:dihydrofolate reductase